MKTGFVGILGLPNAGKSTIVNALVGEKVSIVSSKPQTTRRRILGIWNDSDFQAVLVDAPGKIEAEKGLNAFLAKEYSQVLHDADVAVVVLNLDADKKEDLKRILVEAQKSQKLAAVIISKTDLPDSISRKMQLSKLLEELCPGVPLIDYSSRWRGSDFKYFKEALRSALGPKLKEESRPIFSEDIYTPQALRELVAEVVREKCFEELHQEVPYGLVVRIDKYEESEGIDRIHAEILVAQESHKPIVLGKGGIRIKQIGQKSRIEIEKLAGKKVFLGLQVRVKEKWDQDPIFMKKMGYSHDE